MYQSSSKATLPE